VPPMLDQQRCSAGRCGAPSNDDFAPVRLWCNGCSARFVALKAGMRSRAFEAASRVSASTVTPRVVQPCASRLSNLSFPPHSCRAGSNRLQDQCQARLFTHISQASADCAESLNAINAI